MTECDNGSLSDVGDYGASNRKYKNKNEIVVCEIVGPK